MDIIEVSTFAGSETLSQLEERFETMPWDNGMVRVASRTTALLERAKKRSDQNPDKVVVAVLPPGASADLGPTHYSRVHAILDSILGLIPPEKINEGTLLVSELRQTLEVICGRESRSKGGWQYSNDFMLDSVLFADNLRPAHEQDLMNTTVKQSLVLTRSNVLFSFCFIV